MSLKANELRIGNMVCVFPGNVIKVTPLLIVEQYQSDLANEPYCSPIPISKEWLERLGFDVIEEYKNITIFSMGDLCVYLGKTERSMYVESHDYQLHFDYVHQLQNIIFTLKGKELELIK